MPLMIVAIQLAPRELESLPMTIFGDGKQTRSFCYVSDLIEGFVRLMNSDLREPCNLGNPVERTILELAEAVHRMVGMDGDLTHKPLPTDDPSRRRPDISRAQKHLGWAPKISFEEGLQRTIDWFRENSD